MVYETYSENETLQLGQKLGESAKSGSIYALDADLGCGKTVLARGFAKGLGVEGMVNSPTFTILKSYNSGRLPFHHFDVYRILDPAEMDEIGYEDCFFSDGVSFIEWAGQIRELLPETTVWLKIEKDPQKGFDYRRITVDHEDTGN